jgi:hypothetical protein
MSTITVKDLSTGSSTVVVSDKGTRGRAGLVWREDWLGTVDYYVGDAVQYLGSSYICKRYIAANVTGFPIVLPDDWHLLGAQGSKGGTRTAYSPIAPLGSCTIGGYIVESDCLTAGGVWEDSVIGDMWIDSTTDEVYILISTAPIDWRDISKNVTSTDVEVTSHNNLPAGNLQDALEHLEDQLYQQTAAPTGATLSEGDLWYDTTTDRMNVYRNNTWEVLVTSPALSDDTGYDNISMNGGYF